MKKIVMLTCLKSNRVCTGAACLRAFYERRKSFEIYNGQEVEVVAFMKCNGCDSDPNEDAGILEKVERLKKEQVETVHVGICTKKKDGTRCGNIEKIMDMIEKQGITIIDGTH